jgi:hypothetical protein
MRLYIPARIHDKGGGNIEKGMGETNDRNL